MRAALKRTFDATPEPKLVIAVGECGPPTPIDLMRGILEAIGRRNAGAPGR
jgi:Ni,Fe-hydrogenase III small subunit